MGVTQRLSAMQIGLSAASDGAHDPGASNGITEEMPGRHDPGAQPLAHAGPHWQASMSCGQGMLCS